MCLYWMTDFVYKLISQVNVYLVFKIVCVFLYIYL